MAELLQTKIRVWDDGVAAAPGTRALTVAAVQSLNGLIPSRRRANLLRLWWTISGTGVTGLGCELRPGQPGGAVAAVNSVPVCSYVNDGVAFFQPGDYQLDFGGVTTGLIMWEIPVSPGMPLEVWAYRIGGGAGSLAIVSADLIEI